MENPYWHPEAKTHAIDLQEVQLLCFDLFNLVTASANMSPPEGGELSSLVAGHHRMAEGELSKRLLRLAVLVRTFDDVMAGSTEAEAYESYKKSIDENANFGHVFEGGDLNVRECCNKVIHAEDVRPVYEEDPDAEGDDQFWRMTGEIELGGVRGGKQWLVALYVLPFLEAVLDLTALRYQASS
jgi:hypothetical protein